MTESASNAVQNRGLCSTCGNVVPAHHETRANQVFLVKECPTCGKSDTVVSTNAVRYQEKRALTNYQGEAEKTCGLNCMTCDSHKPPTLVFLDVTNRCNMNCPICLANIPAMGFRFDPPKAYFEKVFARLSLMDPKPKIQLFGGEPTCRDDLIELIGLAREKYGLEARVVTNGIRLANEDYCKKLLATGCQLMFSFDGRAPEIYERTRKHPKSYERKLQALENIRKYRKSKITLMVCVGEGINDKHLPDLVDYCHGGRDFIAAMDLIPLVATWGPEKVDTRNTTIEDVERIMIQQFPGLAFFPAGIMYKLTTLRNTFEMGRLTFGGAHPNCEAVSAMISDGTRYVPVTRYLRRPLNEAISDLLALDARMEKALPNSLLVKLLKKRGARLVYGWSLLRLMRRSIDTRALFGGAAFPKLMNIIWGLIRGVKMKLLLRANTKVQGVLRLIVLPFEEKECVEAARLIDCPAQFAYEHPVTKEIKFMPVCAWAVHKNGILKTIAESYGIAEAGQEGMTGLKPRAEVAQELADQELAAQGS